MKLSSLPVVTAILSVLLGSCATVRGWFGPSGPVEWQLRCAERLRGAQKEMIREVPGFDAGEVVFENEPRGVRIVMKVPDGQHARFYRGAPAEYIVHVVEKASAEPGTLGGEVGTEADSQVSLGLSRWTTARTASMEVQIAEGKKAFKFKDAFGPALDECLRDPKAK